MRCIIIFISHYILFERQIKEDDTGVINIKASGYEECLQNSSRKNVKAGEHL
jgi:hypothetical protein